jgi:hypothetical protein
MLNLIISTIVFFIAVWYLNRSLDEQEIAKGMTRSVLVFVLASLVSWVRGRWWTGHRLKSMVPKRQRKLLVIYSSY